MAAHMWNAGYWRGGEPTGMVPGGDDGGTRSHILLSLCGLRCAQETHGNLRHQVRSNAQRQINEGRRHDEDEDEARRSRSRGERRVSCEQQVEAISASDGHRYAEPCGPLAVSALLSAQPIAVVVHFIIIIIIIIIRRGRRGWGWGSGDEGGGMVLRVGPASPASHREGPVSVVQRTQKIASRTSLLHRLPLLLLLLHRFVHPEPDDGEILKAP